MNLDVTKILIFAISLLISAYCIKYFKSLKDITKPESIKKFCHDTLTALGLALIVGLIPVAMFNANFGSELRKKSSVEQKLLDYPPDKNLIENHILNQPFRWIGMKIQANINVPKYFQNMNYCYYTYSLEYKVKNVGNVARDYQIDHRITSLIKADPHVKISHLQAYRVDESGTRKYENLIVNKDSSVIYSNNDDLWMARTNVPKILLAPNEEIIVKGQFEYSDHLNNGMQIYGVSYICNNLEYEMGAIGVCPPK